MSDVKYPITGSVWFRESTQEWVLELEGSINGTYFIDRHTEPSTTLPEDVPGLPSLYGKLAKAVEAAEELSAAFYSDGNVTERHLRACKAGVKLHTTLAEIKGESHE